MNNKSLAFVLATLLIVSIFPAAYAQETATQTDAQIDADIDVMHSEIGVKIKFLQLERALKRLMIRGSLVIDYIEDEYPDADTQDLEAVLDELELLIEETQNVDYDTDLRELINTYIDIKQDARSLVAKFKELVKQIVSSDDRDGIRSALDAANYDELDQITEEITDLRKQYNANRVERLLSAAGVEDDNLLNQIRNGEITRDEVKEKLRSYAKDLSPEDREAAKAELKKQRNIHSQLRGAVTDHHRANVLERRSDRATYRAAVLEKRSDQAQENGFEWRAKRLDRASDFQEVRAKFLDKRTDNLREDRNQVIKRARAAYNDQHNIDTEASE